MGLTAMIRSPTRTLLSALIGKHYRPTKHRQFHCKNQTLSRIGTFVHRFQGLAAFPVRPAHFSYTTTSDNPPRDSLDFDVVIVGAGPAGLAAAIRLRQLCQNGGPDLSVCVLEKGGELGAHTLSGNVLETRALDELLPDWKSMGAPVRVPVTNDRFLFLTENRHVRLPSPHPNHSNYIISLSELVRWLGSQAEEAGVDIFPGFAASEEAIRRFNLRGGQGVQHQTYALGVKEVWEVEEGRHREGEVVHSLGYPLGGRAYGGGFLYHMDDRRVAVGLVVALDYDNPFLDPFGEFQKYKLHPEIRKVLEGGSVLQYGARAINEGGLQSVPELSFPGGALIGCAAGFLNVPKVKGTHTAMKSGMLAAESAYAVLAGGGVGVGYGEAVRRSWVWEELKRARNVRPLCDSRSLPLDSDASPSRPRGTQGKSGQTSSSQTCGVRGRSTDSDVVADVDGVQLASASQPLHYPKPDNRITFDILTSLYRSNTNHDHDQPSHLRLKDAGVPSALNWPLYEGPEGRYCPAKVYEYVSDDGGTPRLQINAQNCLHCKACDIKDPSQNILWTVPEGGGGPGYSTM